MCPVGDALIRVDRQAYGQKDTMKLIGALLDYVNAPENVCDFIRSLFFSRLLCLFCSYFLT